MLRVLRFLLACWVAFVAPGQLHAQTAAFSISPRSGCAPLAVSFTNQSSGTGNTYQWNLGNSVTTATTSPSTTYGSPGIYYVTLIATSAGGADTTRDSIIVYGGPTVSFSGTALAGCMPHPTQFTTTVVPNAPGGLHYSWAFGDGMTDTAANPLHIYQTPGTFTVSVAVTNGPGCVSPAVRSSYVTAWPLPQPAFVADQRSHCGFPATVNFTASAGGALSPYSYSWVYGDGSTGTGQQSAHSYNAGTFTVKEIVTDSRGCTDSAVAPAYINVLGAVPSFVTYNVCEDSATTFTNTTGYPQKAHWDYGDGIRDSGDATTHVYFQPGVYTVSMTVTIDGCVKTATQQITIYPKAKASSQLIPAIPCPAPITVQLAASSDLPATYYWKWKNGPWDSGQTITRFYPVTQEDTFTLYAKTVHGCVTEVYVDTIMIRKILPGIIVIPRVGCAPATAGHALELRTNFPSDAPHWPPPYPAPAVSYLYVFTNGDSSTLATPYTTYRDTSEHRPRVIFVTANGCTDTGYTMVHYSTPPLNPKFDTDPDSICVNQWFSIYNRSPIQRPETDYTWYSAGLVYTGNKDSARARTFSDSSFTIVMVATYHGCDDTAHAAKRIFVHPPSAIFSVVGECWPSLKVSFLNRSLGADESWWAFGDGQTDTSKSPVHYYGAAGSYLPSLVTYNRTSGCFDTALTDQYAPVKLVDPGFSVQFPIYQSCIGTPVKIITKYPSYLVDDQYPWYVRVATETDTSDWESGNVDHFRTFSTTGKHDITVFFRYGANSCIYAMSFPDTIAISRPIPRFNVDVRRGCEPLMVNFRDSSGNEIPGLPNMVMNWYPGTGDSLVYLGANMFPHYLYPKVGTYSPMLVVIDASGCIDTLKLRDFIAVHKTVARFDVATNGGGPDTACLGVPIQFRSASTAVTAMKLHWDFGDGTTDTATAPLHVYRTRGRYTVRLTATDSIGCADTIVRPAPITILAPYAGFSSSKSVSLCPPMQVTFTNSSTGASGYRWNFGDGSPGPVVVANPVTTYLTIGQYNVTLVASDAFGCRDTAYDTVRVLGYNGAFIFSPSTGCLPLPVTFHPSVSGIPLLTWDFGDGFTDTSQNSGSAAHVYTRSGAFLPKVIFADGAGCSAISNALDSVYIDAVTADFSWSLPCADTPFTLTDKSGGVYGQPVSFRWSSPAAVTGASGNPALLSIHNAGTFPVTLIATNAAGCADTITKNVLVNELPQVWAGPDTAICPGDTAHLAASGTALQYFWAPSFANPGAAISCTICDSPLAWTATPVVYIVAGKDANGCYARDSVRVNIQLRTTSTTGPDGQICYGESYQLHAAGADTYQWLPAETLDRPSSASPVARPNTTTTYMVISQEGSCQVDTQRTRVVVNPLPNFSAGPDKTIVLGGAATLEPRGAVTRIEWLYSDTTLSCWDCNNPNAHPMYTRTYWAKAVNEYGCESTDSVTVFVRCNGSQVFIPNTFTPNGDGQNDRFYPQGAGLDQMASFRVFNRWGELVFEAMNVPLNSASAGWDGTYKGQALAPDTYVYTMTSRCRTGEVINFKGDVTLVR